jgi:hypothetical protein
LKQEPGFLLIPLMVSELCPGQSSKCKNEQRAKTTKFGKRSSISCALHIYPLRSIYLQSFMLIFLVVLELFPGQDFFKGELIQKLGKTELWFLVGT